MSTSLKHYLNSIESALKAGNATEHTHRPALKALLESIDLHITATNEPKRITCGAPDFIITRADSTIGYIEAKDVGKSLVEAERTDQFKRYRRALDNLILTDYLEFRWYVNGDLRQEARLAAPQARPSGKLKAEKDGLKAVEALLQNFLAHQPQAINTPKELAERMARLTHIIRDIIIAAFETEQASMLLQGWRDAFARVLIADLGLPEKTPDFADMFAQTLAYGLFTARIMQPPSVPSLAGGRDTLSSPRERGDRGGFTRQEAQYLIPKSNPFLRDFFIQITGPQLDDEPFASFVDDLVSLLAHTDMAAVLADFGRRTRQEDPVVHFYETFLAAYDPKLREARGVYYTPEPVVSYIVRSVDHLLKSRFNCPQGLAESSKITIPNYDSGLKVKGKNQTRKTIESHKVLILDPATGTGTFLYAVIDHIRRQFMQQGNAGMWPGYVKNHLLPRLFGFELLMAPYAVAHFKLSLQLAGRDLPDSLAELWAYHPGDGERLGVYLTNALEEPHEMTGLPLFTQWVADETNTANEVKQFLPVLVVMGNPPYSVSSTNKGKYIELLLESYKSAVRHERNIGPLSDDYIKFIRFAHDRIEKTDQGIIGVITNHSYLSGLIHRGMRAELMKSFQEIYVLNLHGNVALGETPPEGGKDENVFDIRQGVAIAFFVKKLGNSGTTEIKHADLWGERSEKYKYLLENDVSTTQWQLLEPTPPHFFFVPKDFGFAEEYETGWRVSDIFIVGASGIKTRRDHLLVDFERNELINRFKDIATNDDINTLVSRYSINDTQYWSLKEARRCIAAQPVEDFVQDFLYRPFDVRHIYYNKDIIERGDARWQTMRHLLQNNLALLVMRQVAVGETFSHIGISKNLTDNRAFYSNRGILNVYPLYLYPTEDAAKQKSLFDSPRSPREQGDERGGWPPDEVHGGRVPNLNLAFVAEMERKLGLVFRPHPPAPAGAPLEGKGSYSPPPISARQRGSEVGVWQTPPDLWRKLKPLARQMRREPTPAEDQLWQQLRGRKLLDLKFRRQHAIDRFIVDFYCREARLIIEVDGPIHDYTAEEDAIRQEFLKSQGYRVLRFSNEQVFTELESVLEKIGVVVQTPPQPSPHEGREAVSLPSHEGREAVSPPPHEGEGLGEGGFTPEDIFHYIYAIFHSPAYRARYAEFLKIDFPRVPLTSDVELFRSLCRLGQELVSLHLLESPQVGQFITRYPIAGDNRVEKGYPTYALPQEGQRGRVYINKTQYFEGMPPEIWEFYIGGYQVLDKWLKDRRGRQLSYDDLTHYQQVVVAVQKTIELMAEIDNTIPEWPIQ